MFNLMYIDKQKFKREKSMRGSYTSSLLFFLENVDGFIHDGRSEEITDFMICAILKHDKIAFRFLH